MQTEIAIIGAGMAGLACARRLARAGHTPLVLDKGRGIGGRMATRRVIMDDGDISFDHGAQYLTVRDPDFAADLHNLGAACVRWDDGADSLRLVGVPGMSGLPRAMAAGLNVRLGAQITAVRAKFDRWQLYIDAARIETRHLVMTVPAPQAAALLGDGHPLHHRIAGVAMAPCLTLMAAFPADAPRPFRSRAADDHPLAWIAQDSSKPGRAGTLTTWVAQASVEWSERHLEDTSEIIASRMLPILAEVIGVAPQSAVYAATHRWRYARTVTPLGEPFLCSEDGTLHIGGDWCLGARVEAAWASGTAIADTILEQTGSF
ncbi:FAD-dependent oxidoreductase [Sandarakinorhabdus sp.]|uniref:NAD(P)/FAD-dependent oxidoreductase n=1 Tax=Sandarakinorhabdus sp. TaxID=1916663 RepID=UPI0033414AEE